MKYPNSSKIYQRRISHANRGMVLENEINKANKYYLDNNIALIYKKPTPIGIVNVITDGSKKIITKAFFKEPSTLDYNGIYKGKYIEFDAKETKKKTSFPLANISDRQIKHIINIKSHGGLSFIIVSINNLNYILTSDFLIEFLENNKRKSIPYSLIVEKGFQILNNKYINLNYISIVDKIIGGLQNGLTKRNKEREKS